MKRREYKTDLMINEKFISKIIIDPHYEEKHSESITDEIVLELVEQLSGKLFEPEDVKYPFEYYVTDKMELHGKKYRLVWLLENNEVYVGVINAYRRR